MLFGPACWAYLKSSDPKREVADYMEKASMKKARTQCTRFFHDPGYHLPGKSLLIGRFFFGLINVLITPADGCFPWMLYQVCHSS